MRNYKKDLQSIIANSYKDIHKAFERKLLRKCLQVCIGFFCCCLQMLHIGL